MSLCVRALYILTAIEKVRAWSLSSLTIQLQARGHMATQAAGRGWPPRSNIVQPITKHMYTKIYSSEE